MPDSLSPGTDMARRASPSGEPWFLHLGSEQAGVEPVAARRQSLGSRSRSRVGARPRQVERTDPLPHNLPAVTDDFIGRRQQLGDVDVLLSEAPLVTLTGCPGVGKSRLALEVASRLVAHYPDGVWRVDLAAAGDGRLVSRALASSLALPQATFGLGQETGELGIGQIAAHLRNRSLLLLLDDCDQVVTACAELVTSLLETCPGLTVLATCRRPLSIAGERTWQVPPLASSVTNDTKPEGVRFFCHWAGLDATEAALSCETVAQVTALSNRLDGNPQAMKLAAAWVGPVTLEGIRGHLERAGASLSRGEPKITAEHSRSPEVLPSGMAEIVASWSVDMLSPPQRAVLQRLAVCPGEVTADAAQEVCAAAEANQGRVGEHLAVLVDRCLVTPEVVEKRARYRLPRSVRDAIARRPMDARRVVRVRRRFLDWVVALAERGEAELSGSAQSEWLDRLEAEHGNLIAAVECALADGHAERALRLSGAMAEFWRLRGRLREGLDVLEACLRDSGSASFHVRAKACWGAGALAILLGELSHARRRAEASLRAARQADDEAGVARALILLGSVSRYRGDSSTAIRLLEQGLALARRLQADDCVSEALARLGEVYLLRGDVSAALALLEKGHEFARQRGERRGEAAALLGQGWAAFDRGEYEAAEARVRVAEDLARALGDQVRIGEALLFRGELARRRGDVEAAATRFHDCHELALAIRVPLLAARALGGQGRVALTRECFEDARQLFKGTLDLSRELGLPYLRTRALFGLAAAAASTGEPSAAQADLEDALGTARRYGDRQGVTTATHALGTLAREQGELERAQELHGETLRAHLDAGDTEMAALSLEAIAAVTLDQGRFDVAARLFATAETALRELGRYFERWPWQVQRHQRDLAQLEEALDTEALREAWSAGQAHDLSEMAAYALRAWGGRGTVASGGPKLTCAELDVARLVVQRLTSREVAERLFLSPRTVEAHLQRVFRKLGINSRRQLREVAERLPELNGAGKGEASCNCRPSTEVFT